MQNREFIIALLSEKDAASAIVRERERLLFFIPEIEGMIGFEHRHPHHHLDVWEHTLLALRYAPNQLNIRLSLLFHDIGKPVCYQQVDGVRHYKGHPEASAKIAEAILDRLGFERELADEVVEIIRNHDTPLSEEEARSFPARAKTLFEVQRCDALAHNPLYNQKRLDYIRKWEEILCNLQ